ncbi:MAG: glycosyltransferase family 4 protein [Bellilinea sp.]|jgi:glycosyltransferase involved in cell wall biosynthesis
MRILIVLTYYRPHTSGLTIYAERLARALVRRGHQVTVMTSQYDGGLAREEWIEGARVVRIPVLFRLSKGVVMPSFGWRANQLIAQHDAIQLHLPQFDAAGIALRGRLLRKPTVITYHCDLRMPPGALNWAANQGIRLMNDLAARFTHRIVTYTQDYAENSTYLQRFMYKLKVIPPPVELPVVSAQSVADFRNRTNPNGHRPVIGMAARLATEKGVEVLLAALEKVIAVYPMAQVQFAGTYMNIIGEEGYYARVMPRIQRYQQSGNWQFLGNLPPDEMARFYPNLDVLVLPSLNSTEAFGLVQIEAMINGVPSIASNLPGVRQPVRLHEMGEIVKIGDAEDLAEALLKVLRKRDEYIRDPQPIRQRYLPEAIAAEYENLFAEIQKELEAN